MYIPRAYVKTLASAERCCSSIVAGSALMVSELDWRVIGCQAVRRGIATLYFATRMHAAR